MTGPLWRPSADRIAATNLTAFMRMLKERIGVEAEDYRALHRFSVENLEAFWAAVWDYCGIVASYRGGPILLNPAAMPGARFFPEARLNFAENLLRRRDDAAAILFRAEDKVSRSLSWDDLYAAVARMAAALRRAGVGPGDRCAGFVPNAPEAVIAMLGAASIGAVWTSCSPDFGAQGVLDRFGQVKPKVLVACDGYYYNGKWMPTAERVAAVAAQLPSVERVVLFSIGGIAGTTGKLAFLVWIISMVMGFLQSFTYAEIAGMFGNKSGGASVYGATAWLRYSKFIAPLSVWCNWLAWTPVLSLGCAIAAGYILNSLFPVPAADSQAVLD